MLKKMSRFKALYLALLGAARIEEPLGGDQVQTEEIL